MSHEGEQPAQLPWQHVTAPAVPDQPDHDYYVGAAHVIAIKPHDLASKASTLDAKITSLSNTLKSISQTWEGLKLGWVGQTQQEADEFNNQWHTAAKEMFGDDNTPKSVGQISAGECALGKIQALADAAAKTYANAEEGLASSFYKFGEELAGTYVASEWPDPNNPNADKTKHPELKTDIPTLSGPLPTNSNPDFTRHSTDAPIEETT